MYELSLNKHKKALVHKNLAKTRNIFPIQQCLAERSLSLAKQVDAVASVAKHFIGSNTITLPSSIVSRRICSLQAPIPHTHARVTFLGGSV